MVLEQLDIDILLDNLNRLRLETMEQLSPPDVAYVLMDFLLNWGQRLHWAETDHLSAQEKARLRSLSLTLLPFSTAADFPNLTQHQLYTLALASTTLNLYVMLVDPIIDEPLTAPAAKLAIEPVLRHCYAHLHRLFAVDSPFWGEMERLMQIMAQRMLAEQQRLRSPVPPFSLDEFRQIAYGKMAFAKVNCTAMALLNGTPELLPTLGACWDAISLASIVQDDCLDWRKDYVSGNYTYLLTQVLVAPSFQDQVYAGRLPDLGYVGAALFCTGGIEALYQIADAELEAADRRATAIHCLALAALLQKLQAQIRPRHANSLTRKLAVLIQRVQEGV